MEHKIQSTSRVFLICGPAGSGKSTLAKQLSKEFNTIRLSYDVESLKRGIVKHPLPKEVENEIKVLLDEKLIQCLESNQDVILDYSFWSKQSRRDYINLLKQYQVEPIIYYLNCPKDVVISRIKERKGKHSDDIILDLDTAKLYFDHFEIPTEDEGEIIVVDSF